MIHNRAHPKVADKLKELIKDWAHNEFKEDPSLSLIPSLYQVSSFFSVIVYDAVRCRAMQYDAQISAYIVMITVPGTEERRSSFPVIFLRSTIEEKSLG